jgi:phage tail-like protein
MPPQVAERHQSTNGAGAQPGSFLEPHRAYNFNLLIQGVVGHFMECSGLEAEVIPIRYREGGAGQVVHAIPGPVRYGAVTLRYGLTASAELSDWFTSAINGLVQRRNVTIAMLDSSGTSETIRWDLTNAWPSKWRGATLDALSQELAIEELVLVFDTLKRG